jgi:hypothetical protein
MAQISLPVGAERFNLAQAPICQLSVSNLDFISKLLRFSVDNIRV